MATPICAVAAANWRSAPRMSGRRRSRSDGSPTGTFGGAAGIGATVANSASSAPGCLSQEYAEAMDRRLKPLFQSRDLSFRLGQNGGGLLGIEIAGEAMLETVASQCDSVLLGFDVLPRDCQPTLEAARLDVIASYFRDQSHLGVCRLNTAAAMPASAASTPRRVPPNTSNSQEASNPAW